jgi:alpha-D-ribose 1-methylphosphonate 5-phosphate C-P lyase
MTAAALYSAANMMETTMRMIRPAIVAAAMLGALSGAAQADTVPAFKGNDTGGIISYSLVGQSDVRAMAVDHCARYGKVVKFLGAQNYYGGYVSFACRWVPYGASDRPLRVRY